MYQFTDEAGNVVVPRTGYVDRNVAFYNLVYEKLEVVPRTGYVDRNSSSNLSITICMAVVPRTGYVDRNRLRLSFTGMARCRTPHGVRG